MTEPEAAALTDLLRELWPSKFHWTPGMTGLWIERLARPEFDRRQCEAVIRQARTEDDGHKPSLKRITARFWKVHEAARPTPAASSQHVDLAPADWSVIRRDHDSAAAWWHENRKDAAEIVRLATLAYPMWAAKWARFLDAKFRPEPGQCLGLRCAWQEYHESGARPAPAFEPGVMSGAV